MASTEVVAALGILEHAGRTLLVANWREFFGSRHLCWDIPGGGVNPGESLAEGCVREMKEETGLAVAVVDLAFVVERFGFRTGDAAERARFYFFEVRSEEEEPHARVRPADPDIVDWGFLTVEEIRSRSPHAYQQAFLGWMLEGRTRRYLRVDGPACIPRET